jgi:CheY-like chemotaxis protein
MKILYVEDNDDNVYVVKNRFTRAGHTVLVAVDGLQALDMARADQPDLILMDLSLPEMDGWEATRRLKASPDTRDIPVIALSAHAMAGDREKALAAGCDDYDTKPVDFARLRAKMDALLGGGGR